MTGHVDTRCLLCGRGKGHEPFLDDVLFRCVSCGFVWTARSQGGAQGTQLYDASYFDSGGYSEYFKDLDQRRYEAKRRLGWLTSTVRPGSLLEAGCAAGFFVDGARRAGIHATGVELAEVCVRFAIEKLGLPVREGRFESVAASTRVGAVCAFHVLEHVDDPRKFMTTARSVLAPGGWLALEVPNIESSAARLQGRSWHGLQPAYHRWHFSPQSLSRLVREYGFRIRRRDTVPVSHYLRPRYRLSPKGAWTALKESLPRTPHPRRHDLLRLLAQLPEQSHCVRAPGLDAAAGQSTPLTMSAVAGQSEEEL